MDFHLKKKKLFYTDTETRKIYKLTLQDDVLNPTSTESHLPVNDFNNGNGMYLYLLFFYMKLFCLNLTKNEIITSTFFVYF